MQTARLPLQSMTPLFPITLSILGVFTDQDSTASATDLSSSVGRVCVLTVSTTSFAILNPRTVTPFDSTDRDLSLDTTPPCSDSSASSSVPINDRLSSTQRSRPSRLLDDYSDVFAQHSDDLGRTSVFTHHIDTGD